MRLYFLLHESLDLAPSSPTHSSHTSLPILVIAIVGILAIFFLLVSYYIFMIKWNQLDPLRRLRRLSFSRTWPSRRRVGDPLMAHTLAENRGLQEADIRAIPILEFKKSGSTENAECAVCLNEFQEHERLRSIPNCSHMFHIDCIDVWLQNNANCPLCRNSISISSMDHFMLPTSSLPRNPNLHSDNFIGRDEDFVVIEIGGGEQNQRIQERLNSGELSGHVSVSPSQRKLQQPKMVQKKRGKGLSHVLSMGDECIDVGKRDETFLVQPIRRSISMDSAADRHLYLAVQEVIQKHSQKTDDVCQDEGSSNRVKRSFFSFGHGRGSKSLVLPVDLEM